MTGVSALLDTTPHFHRRIQIVPNKPEFPGLRKINTAVNQVRGPAADTTPGLNDRPTSNRAADGQFGNRFGCCPSLPATKPLSAKEIRMEKYAHPLATKSNE